MEKKKIYKELVGWVIHHSGQVASNYNWFYPPAFLKRKGWAMIEEKESDQEFSYSSPVWGKQTGIKEYYDIYVLLDKEEYEDYKDINKILDQGGFPY